MHVSSDEELYMNAEMAARKWAFELPPAPVGAALIAETVGAEVVVVGEGMAGLCTALSALEAGLDTVIVTASSRPVGRGGSVFAAYSKVMAAQGYPRQEAENFYLQEFAAASYNIDQRKWYSFYNNSEAAMNWLIDMLEKDGVTVVLEAGNEDDPYSPTDQPVGTHAFTGRGVTFAGAGITLALQTLEKNFIARGGRVFYGNVAKQLVREEDGAGRVSAVIARDGGGSYVRFAAKKAVVLATGDFSANREMMARYCPAYAKYYTNNKLNYDAGFVEKGIYQGDGHLMALWAGAAWQRTFPNAPLIQGSRLCAHMPYGAHRGLRLNRNGERFCNEDCNAAYTAMTVLREPGQTAYAIWGSNYAFDVDWHAHGGIRGGAKTPPQDVIKMWERDVANGSAVKGDTVAEVIGRLGLPADTADAAVERYNALCRQGRDEDFHKKAKYLQEIKNPPFYGGLISQYRFFSVLGGPRTNHRMQICDENDVPIKGLYAAGTMIGDMFAGCYSFRIAGHNYGCCLTFGYLTGKYIAGNE
ncbi:Succinate dehydrogenase/fumarate reductase, flavoprotein subunit [Sporobacter termitidis DSM 10068]|uniref:Succinate dehydrogenase/fumarate reductase, flavoprotein subunit n=1 Tax=Sporobacter termitidis DSM 10068 TaxID=1123282 RepID=A0A1M5WH60_9FIRM|nr:FAD-dependent oxidoreductase [Sporobacter termitidis]SHH86826.1 Succinate dehydrogenase/fumarate reductase, flavoprotein subunit [Sporobacter termitidis DSM 10068]